MRVQLRKAWRQGIIPIIELLLLKFGLELLCIFGSITKKTLQRAAYMAHTNAVFATATQEHLVDIVNVAAMK